MTTEGKPIKIVDAGFLPEKPAEYAPMNPMAIIAEAVRAGKGVEDLQVLYNLQKDWESRQARTKFDDAVALFQRDCPPIQKNKSSGQATAGGSGFQYRYADLAQIERTVKPILNPLGLAYSFDMDLTDGAVRCVCHLRGFGHTETATFVAPVDKGGRMNDIQKHGSALSYAKRYALSQVLGISTSDDNDAVEAPPSIPMQPINDQQLANLEDLLDATNADKAKFKAFFKVNMLGDLPESEYGRAESMLRSKLK